MWTLQAGSSVPTTFDQVVNKVLVLLVDISAFGDVKLHGDDDGSVW